MSCFAAPPHYVYLVLPICTWVPLLEQDSLSGAICPWRKLTLPPQQPSVVNSSCCWEWNFMSPHPCTCWDFGRLDLYRSYARSHSLCEFMCVNSTVMPSKYCFAAEIYYLWLLQSPSPPGWSLSLEGRRCSIHVSLRTGPQQSYPLHIDQMWPLYYYLL